MNVKFERIPKNMFTSLRQKQHKHLDSNKIFSVPHNSVDDRTLFAFDFFFNFMDGAFLSMTCFLLCFLLFRLIKRAHRSSLFSCLLHFFCKLWTLKLLLLFAFNKFEKFFPSGMRALSTSSNVHKRFNEHAIGNGICLIIPSKLIT